MMGLEGN
jgi:serine/threonine-protein kinase ULK4